MVSGKQFRILFALGILAISLICQAKERSWVEVKSPNFTVISDTSEKEARRTAHRFEQFRNAMQVMIPGHKIDSGLPFIIFFARNKDSFKKLLPYGYLQEDRILPAALFLQTPVKC